jgi:hypothetical protein
VSSILRTKELHPKGSHTKRLHPKEVASESRTESSACTSGGAIAILTNRELRQVSRISRKRLRTIPVESADSLEVKALARPARTAPLRLLNATGRGLARLGLTPVSLEPEALLASAARRTGLDDFGDDGFREPLRVLLQSAREQGRLNLLGRVIVRTATLRTLENRLRLLDERKRRPEIERERIVAPIVIIGLPRTGTSILHELLALDPENRAPMTWEVMSPVPRPEAATFGSDPRIEQVDRDLAQTERIVPGFRSMHRMGARLPQECCMLLNHDFMSMQFNVSYRVPDYQDWFERQDLGPAYAFHRWQLQYLQSAMPAEHWVLKSPQHLWTLDALLREYPDARIVHTHRDPISTMASVASLCCLLRGMCSDEIDPHEVGADWSERIAAALESSTKIRQQSHPEDRFFDMQFGDYLADPIAMVRCIYGWLGRELSSKAEERMNAYLATNPQGQHGRHRYRASDYAIDADVLRARLSPYLAHFDVPREPLA